MARAITSKVLLVLGFTVAAMASGVGDITDEDRGARQRPEEMTPVDLLIDQMTNYLCIGFKTVVVGMFDNEDVCFSGDHDMQRLAMAVNKLYKAQMKKMQAMEDQGYSNATFAKMHINEFKFLDEGANIQAYLDVQLMEQNFVKNIIEYNVVDGNKKLGRRKIAVVWESDDSDQSDEKAITFEAMCQGKGCEKRFDAERKQDYCCPECRKSNGGVAIYKAKTGRKRPRKRVVTREITRSEVKSIRRQNSIPAGATQVSSGKHHVIFCPGCGDSMPKGTKCSTCTSYSALPGLPEDRRRLLGVKRLAVETKRCQTHL